MPGIFTKGKNKKYKEAENIKSELYQKIGRLQIESDWLKKSLNSSVKEKKQLIEPEHPEIPVYRQCKLIGLSKSSYYYKPRGESSFNQLLMRLIDIMSPKNWTTG